ncbi:MAG: ComF family protein [Deltaproteobacteria bacterium]|nr:ComF family protein [Deltaproteobacteria bacterium]MBW2154024.1 ComF family protein [Deltaproteobacteria bacterium]
MEAFSDQPIDLLIPFVCADCMKGLLPVRSPMCTRCAAVYHSEEGEDHLCEACIKADGSFRLARALGRYEATLMTLVHRFKYEGKIQLAKPLGRALFSVYNRFWQKERIDMILPVPLHPTRFRSRGFNQSYLLVKNWVKFSDTGFSVPPVIKHILVRIRSTAPQTGLSRKERGANIRGAFSITDAQAIAEKNILLVDDVFTTGATVEECARVLLASGAQGVDVLTLARA